MDAASSAPESVWDYPRPPRVEPSSQRVVVELGGVVVADSTRSVRVLETSHPPVYYLPRADIADGVLLDAPGQTFCEFKGVASYADVAVQTARAPRAAWFYAEPAPGYEGLLGHVAFYPGRMSRCTVDGETVQPQEGDFYGGWVTSAVTGPFKGPPGTAGW